MAVIIIENNTKVRKPWTANGFLIKNVHGHQAVNGNSFPLLVPPIANKNRWFRFFPYKPAEVGVR
jgi:hypothetical protein